MTNISAMKAIAELNKLQEQRGKSNAPVKQDNNKPNSIFDQNKKTDEQTKNLDNQIIERKVELEKLKEEEKKPVQESSPEFE